MTDLDSSRRNRIVSWQRAGLKAAVIVLYTNVLPFGFAQSVSSPQAVSPAERASQQMIAEVGASLPNAPSFSLVKSSVSWEPLAADAGLPDHADEPLTIKKFPLRVLTDEVQIVTSPARIRTKDLRWLLPLAGATATAFATDTKTMRDVVSHDQSFNADSSTASDVLRGAAIGVPALMFSIGEFTGRDHERESGILAGEAIVDAYIFDEAIKYVTLRERPYHDHARGHFFVGSASSDPSFVSGHSIVAWSSAAVLAEEYPKPWQQAFIYTLASGVSLTRVLGQQHFPSDTLLGSTAGWLIGHYVYRAHHRKHVH